MQGKFTMCLPWPGSAGLQEIPMARLQSRAFSWWSRLQYSKNLDPSLWRHHTRYASLQNCWYSSRASNPCYDPPQQSLHPTCSNARLCSGTIWYEPNRQMVPFLRFRAADHCRVTKERFARYLEIVIYCTAQKAFDQGRTRTADLLPHKTETQRWNFNPRPASLEYCKVRDGHIHVQVSTWLSFAGCSLNSSHPRSRFKGYAWSDPVS